MTEKRSAANLMTNPMRIFLSTKVNSFVKWDLIRFFHDNPHIHDTAVNIGESVARPVTDVQSALDSMVESGILHKEQLTDVEVYRLTDDPDILAEIEEFMDACHDREFRVMAIQLVVQELVAIRG